MEEINVKGFHIISKGDETVGIFDASWELKSDFLFENQLELENFRHEIKNLFEGYCGEKVYVMTFEEQQKQIDDESNLYL